MIYLIYSHVEIILVSQLEKNVCPISHKHNATAKPWKCQFRLAKMQLSSCEVENSRKQETHYCHQKQSRIHRRGWLPNENKMKYDLIYDNIKSQHNCSFSDCNIEITEQINQPCWTLVPFYNEQSLLQIVHIQVPTTYSKELIPIMIAEQHGSCRF